MCVCVWEYRPRQNPCFQVDTNVQNDHLLLPTLTLWNYVTMPRVPRQSHIDLVACILKYPHSTRLNLKRSLQKCHIARSEAWVYRTSSFSSRGQDFPYEDASFFSPCVWNHFVLPFQTKRAWQRGIRQKKRWYGGRLRQTVIDSRYCLDRVDLEGISQFSRR